MTAGAIIADYYTARRIAHRCMETMPAALGFRVFQYEQPRTRLTLFGVAVQLGGGREQEVRFQ